MLSCFNMTLSCFSIQMSWNEWPCLQQLSCRLTMTEMSASMKPWILLLIQAAALSEAAMYGRLWSMPRQGEHC